VVHCSGWQIVDYHQTPRPGGDFGQASLHPAVGLVPVVRDTVEPPTQPNPPRRSPLYFAGPEGVLLELTTGDPMGRQAWIDPEIVEINGISTGELEAYKNPAPFTPPADPVPDPAYDPAKPISRSPLRPTNRSLPMPDEVVWQMASQPEPPVPLD
jgi:hypothetical protein